MRYLWKTKHHVMNGLLVFAAAMFLFVANSMEVNAYIQTQGTVIADSAVIRKEANAKSNQIASIMKGDKVTINNEETDADGVVWYKVFVDANTLGYVRGDLIQKEGSSGTSTTTTNTSTTSNTTTSNTDTTTTTTTTTTSGTSETANSSADTTSTPEINTNLTIGANTSVTPVQSLGASVTGDAVRVRADASTNASIVTTVQKSTAITVNGQADGTDGKVWYRVSFIVDGKDVSGFIRSDFVQLSGDLVVVDETAVAEEPVQEPEESVEEPITEEPVNTDYVLKYEANEEGINDWYLYNNIDGVRNKLSEVLDAAEGNGDAIELADAQLKKQKMIIIILAIVLVFLALAVTLLLFKIRDLYYDDFDNYDEEPEEPRHSKNTTPRTVKPVQNERPAARPQGGTQNRPANGQRRPQGNVQGRPQGNPQGRPQGQPTNGQSRPQGHSQGQPRPQGGVSRPVGGQNRPVNGQSRPQSQSTNGQGRPQGQPVNGQPHPQGSAQNYPNGAMNQNYPESNPSKPQRNSQQDAGWKAKNFMADDDDFEFEFLNWDGEEK